MRLPSRLTTPHGLALIAFLTCYLIAIQAIRRSSYRDPSSLFFDPERAFERKYSLEREVEANDFIDLVALNTNYVRAFPDPTFTVGIATVQRENARYFKRTVGSVLAGLTEAERKDLFLVSFFADPEPAVHQAYSEPWVSVVSDEIITYADAPEDVSARAHELSEIDIRFDRKPLFDYVQLLRNCYSHGSPYIVVLEDDVIAAEGWYAKTKTAIETLEGIGEIEDMVYLRLFYNERILGWNKEEWSSYLTRSLFVEAVVLCLLLGILRYYPPASTFLTPLTIATICFIATPLCIALYFAAGRLTVAPLPEGLNSMNKYGCCSQAFVFPRHQIPGLIEYYESVGMGKIDSLTELYANEKDLSRWALTPSVFAHVGSTSSKSSFVSRWGRSNTENIWNFSFELYDKESLKVEHI